MKMITEKSCSVRVLASGLVIAAFATSALASEADLYLPPPENLLRSILATGPENEADVVGTIDALCSGTVKKQSYCALPALVAKLKKQTAQIYADKSGIKMERAQTPAWVIPQLTAGDYVSLPSRDGKITAEQTAESVVTYFVLRTQVAAELAALQKSRIPGRPRDLRQIVMVPSLMAYMQTSDSFAAMLRLHTQIRCDAGEVLCDQVKARIGSAIAAAAKPYLGRIQSFGVRIDTAISDESAGSKERSLSDVIKFARLIYDAETTGRVLRRGDVKAALYAVVADGRGGAGPNSFRQLKRAVVATVEFAPLVERPTEFTPNTLVLSAEAEAKAASELAPYIKKVCDAVEQAMQNYARENAVLLKR